MPETAEETLRQVRVYTTASTAFAYTDDERLVDQLLGLGGRVWGKTTMTRDSDKVWYDISIPERHREVVDKIVEERIANGTLYDARSRIAVKNDPDTTDAPRAA